MPSRPSVTVAVLLALFALAGCATGPGTAPTDALDCQGATVPRQSLEDRTPATELSDTAALDGHEVPDIDLAEWFIVEESDSRVVLLHEYTEPRDAGNGDLREFEVLTISTEFAASLEGSKWMLVQASDCSLAVDLGGLTNALLALDVESPPQPEDSELIVMVTEFACNSGRDAEGRVTLVDLTETADTVEVVIGVEPNTGDQSCPSNPATPFAVELAEPLGDRMIINAGVFPAREIVPTVIDSW